MFGRVLSALAAAWTALSLCAVPAAAKTPAAVTVSAQSAVLIEASSGRVLYAKRETERRPMASTTKIMTALLTLESGGLDEEFTVDGKAIQVEGTSMGLQKGDRVTKRSLAYGMLLPSGNDAANAAAVAVAGSLPAFVQMMNRRAQMIGMTDTHFETPSGLDGERHFSTARDMARLARVALCNPDFAKICGTKTAKLQYGNPPYTRYLSNHNRLLREYKGAIGVKTGFTKKAGRCLVSAAERNGVRLIAVTLNAPNDWQDHRRMLDYGFSQVKAERFQPDVSDVRLPLVGSATGSLPVVAGNAPKLSLGADDKTRLRRVIYADSFYYAPVQAGDLLGTAAYTLDGVLVAEIPLVAAEDAAAQSTEIQIPFSERLFGAVKRFWTSIWRFLNQ